MEKILILSIIFLPLLFTIILMSPLLSDYENFLNRFSKFSSIFHLILNCTLLLLFDFSATDFALKLNINWLTSLGINATFVLDSISILLCTLTSFIFVVAIFSSKKLIKKNHRLYYSLIFLIQSAIIGTFTSSDIFLFFLFWELELLPMYILIQKWGSGNKEKTAMKFLLYTFGGSLFILFAFLIMYFCNLAINGELSSNIENIDLYNFPDLIKQILFIFLFIGFGVKLPIFPLHSWLPNTHAQAPTPISIILSAIMLKMGAYGIFRFNLLMFEDTFIKFAPTIMLLGTITLVYASLCAIAQKDIKRIIAFSGFAHMGLFLIGIAAINQIGIKGALFQLFSHALITCGLFLMAGIIYKNCGTKNINRIQGLGERMPKLMFISIPIIFAVIGIPLLSGFIAEFLIFLGAFTSEIQNAQIMIAIALTSMIICSVYILKIFHGIFFGELNEKYKKVKDIDLNQTVILSTIVTYIILLGVFPSLLINLFNISGVN